MLLEYIFGHLGQYFVGHLGLIQDEFQIYSSNIMNWNIRMYKGLLFLNNNNYFLFNEK